MTKIAVTLSAVLLLCGAPRASDDSFAQLKSDIKERVLSNGMHVIVLENHSAPVASFHVYADVGSAQENDGITGIAHLLEHLAFKGSRSVGTTDYAAESKILDEQDLLYDAIIAEKYSPSPDKEKLLKLQKSFEELEKKAKQYVVNNEYFDLLLGAGDAGVNAYTSTDATQFINSLPSNKVEFWMAVSSDRFLNPVFREFYKEKNVVMEERRRSLENNPRRRLSEDFYAAAFKAHSYRHAVLGHMSDLERITRKDVKDFFAKYYTPENLTAVIAGDVNADTVFSMAETYFGRLKRGSAEHSVRTVEPEQWGERRVTVSADAEPHIVIGYKRPSVKDADENAIQAAMYMLGEGRSSRLYSRLVKKDRIASDVGVSSSSPGDKYPSLAVISVEPLKGVSTERILAAVDDEIKKISESGISADELKKYTAAQKMQLVEGMKSNASMAAILSYFQSVRGNWRELFADIEAIQRLTPDDVKQAAKKYLVKKHRTIGEIVSERGAK